MPSIHTTALELNVLVSLRSVEIAHELSVREASPKARDDCRGHGAVDPSGPSPILVHTHNLAETVDNSQLKPTLDVRMVFHPVAAEFFHKPGPPAPIVLAHLG